MDDRELLELAAKAAGIDLIPMEVKNVTQRGDDRFIGYMTDVQQWQKGWFNPLRDDDDALRLAVKLGLQMYIFLADDGIGISNTQVNRRFTEHHTNDPYAATRRAIVRAAAEIGKEMK